KNSLPLYSIEINHSSSLTVHKQKDPYGEKLSKKSISLRKKPPSKRDYESSQELQPMPQFWQRAPNSTNLLFHKVR
ncbi:hypothetical protein, partial [Bartonella sp. AP57NXGY]|uniref:hypothetical protein n=1 Tax=Bartonella sp. AP57NXGY TaxID=3243497 RepID=UPI0035CF5F56